LVVSAKSIDSQNSTNTITGIGESIAKHEAMSDRESEVTAAWKRFKQNIDADRPDSIDLAGGSTHLARYIS